MGKGQSKALGALGGRGPQMPVANRSGCSTNLDCENPDAGRSDPNNRDAAGNPILVRSCPGAECVNGQCDCSSSIYNCQLDPYLGTCCQDIVSDSDQYGELSFCVEYTEPPELGLSIACDAKNQSYKVNGKEIMIPGAQICQWCDKLVHKPVENFTAVNVADMFMY